MKKLIKITILMILAVTMFLESGITSTAATSKSKITTGDYIKLMVEASKIKVDSAESNPYVAAALREGLIKEGEFTSFSSNIKKEDAALIANRADELLHGTSYDEYLYNQVKDKERISDIKKITSSKRDAAIKVFIKGIMTGASNGKYTHTRKFNGKEYLTLAEAKTIRTRVTTPSKRKKISPDGQVIRTTNLPKNYKSFKYILESFPNEFYEMKFRYQRTKYSYKPVELVNYTRPARITKMNFNGYNMQEVLDANLDMWANKIETNLNTRLNVDYRTVNNEWINTLRKTYFIFDDIEIDKERKDDIKKYINKMKKNKVVVKGTVSVEPSTLYYASGFYMRAYIKFKVLSATNLKTEEDVIYGDNVYIPGFKTDKWYTMYVDIELGSNNGGSTGEDYGIVLDSIF